MQVHAANLLKQRSSTLYGSGPSFLAFLTPKYPLSLVIFLETGQTPDCPLSGETDQMHYRHSQFSRARCHTRPGKCALFMDLTQRPQELMVSVAILYTPAHVGLNALPSEASNLSPGKPPTRSKAILILPQTYSSCL